MRWNVIPLTMNPNELHTHTHTYETISRDRFFKLSVLVNYSSVCWLAGKTVFKFYLEVRPETLHCSVKHNTRKSHTRLFPFSKSGERITLPLHLRVISIRVLACKAYVLHLVCLLKYVHHCALSATDFSMYVGAQLLHQEIGSETRLVHAVYSRMY